MATRWARLGAELPRVPGCSRRSKVSSPQCLESLRTLRLQRPEEPRQAPEVGTRRIIPAPSTASGLVQDVSSVLSASWQPFPSQNRLFFHHLSGQPELSTSITQHKLAATMYEAATSITNVTAWISIKLSMYGIGTSLRQLTFLQPAINRGELLTHHNS